MCLIDRIVRLGFQYVDAVTRELELAIGQPSWFVSYRKARQIQTLLERHSGGIEQVVSQRLRELGHESPPEFEAWRLGNQRLRDLQTALMDAVERRRRNEALEHASHLHSLLGQTGHESVALLSRLEPLTGDLTKELAKALRGPSTDRL